MSSLALNERSARSDRIAAVCSPITQSHWMQWLAVLCVSFTEFLMVTCELLTIGVLPAAILSFSNHTT